MLVTACEGVKNLVKNPVKEYKFENDIFKCGCLFSERDLTIVLAAIGRFPTPISMLKSMNLRKLLGKTETPKPPQWKSRVIKTLIQWEQIAPRFSLPYEYEDPV